MNFPKAFKLTYVLASFLAVALIFSSCAKEQVEELAPTANNANENLVMGYPAEITIDNWEQFVDAPQEVIDYHAQKERDAIKNQKAERVTTASDFPDANNRSSALIFGFVQAFKSGAWQPIAGVDISTDNCGSTSVNFSPDNYFFSSTCTGPLCMEYNTSVFNGVSTFDLVLISRHINNIACFTTAREYLGADADRDGDIDTNDTDVIRKIILGVLVAWPNSDNVIFVTEQDYNDIQSLTSGCSTDQFLLQAVGISGPCLNQFYVDRRAIKTGDVNGSFSF